MTIVPIYDAKGFQVNQLNIDDDLMIVNGRVSKGKTNYYKGVGIKYNQHSVAEVTDDYILLKKDPVFYMGYTVIKKSFEGKTGIFQERYQPQFTDFIGSCGSKELSIIENSVEFEKSSVHILDSVNYDKENHQYYFVLNYKCDRKSYLQYGNSKKLKELLDYMLQNDWNFIWDKKSITDISYNGLVTDVADIFVDNRLSAKLGTIYSVLYSLGNMNKTLYEHFLKECGLNHEDQSSYIFNSLEILKQNKIDISSLLVYSDKYQNYKHIVLNYLLTGKNCGHCCLIDLGENIKQQYIQNAISTFK